MPIIEPNPPAPKKKKSETGISDAQSSETPNESIVSIIENAEICFVDDEDKENVQSHGNSFLLSGKYFSVISSDKKLTKAKCNTCNKINSASKNTTSNFIRHLKVSSIYVSFETV